VGGVGVLGVGPCFVKVFAPVLKKTPFFFLPPLFFPPHVFWRLKFGGKTPKKPDFFFVEGGFCLVGGGRLRFDTPPGQFGGHLLIANLKNFLLCAQRGGFCVKKKKTP